MNLEEINQYLSELAVNGAAHAVVAKEAQRVATERWTKQYPQIASELWAWHERYCTHYDDDRSEDPAVHLSPDERAERDKREEWQLLNLLGSVIPGFPVTELYRQYCEDLDRTTAQHKQDLAQIQADHETIMALIQRSVAEITKLRPPGRSQGSHDT